MPSIPTRAELIDVFQRVVDDMDPSAAVHRSLVCDDGEVIVGGHSIGRFDPADIGIIGVGKAAVPMASAVLDLTGAGSAVVATPYVSDSDPSSDRIEILIGGHPLPTPESITAGQALVDVAQSMQQDQLLVAVVSGGGSACAEVPADAVSFDDLVSTYQWLLGSGLPIEDVNEVRAVLSAFKAGGLVAGVAATVVTLVLSDVVGGGPELVASGPTIPSRLGARARKILERHADAAVAASVRRAADRFESRGDLPAPVVEVVGGPSQVARAAQNHLGEIGYQAQVVDDSLRGEARVEATVMYDNCAPGSVWVAAGETTVSDVGNGIGGRNHEAALSVLADVGRTGGLFAALGTDGIDGGTDAAGAIVDDSALDRATERGWDWEAELRLHNSGPLLADIGASVVTGPTGTNVCDLWMCAKPGTRVE